MTDEPREPAPEREHRGGRRGRATRPMDPKGPCMNCGDPTHGQYCPTCGQRKVSVQVSVRTLVMDVLEDQFILDRRLPRTLGALFLKPGHLTVEHVNGRIVRYIHPFRLYLVSSLIFFLFLSFYSLQLVRRALDQEGNAASALASIEGPGLDEDLAQLRAMIEDSTLTGEERSEILAEEAALLDRRRELRADSLDARIDALQTALDQISDRVDDEAIPAPVRDAIGANAPTIRRQLEVATAQRDSLAADTSADTTGTDPPAPDAAPIVTGAGDDRPLRERFGWDENPPEINLRLFPGADSAFASQIRRVGGMSVREAAETLVGTFFNWVPTLMFILLPVFAGVLKLLYIRRRRYYAEHFVFLLHVHSMVFVLATLMLFLRERVTGWLEVVLLAWILVYIYLAMKRVYGQGWFKTFVKYWTLGWMYFWIILASTPVAFIATILLF